MKDVIEDNHVTLTFFVFFLLICTLLLALVIQVYQRDTNKAINQAVIL